MRKISINQLTTMRWSFDEDVVFYRSRGVKLIGICRDKAQDFGIEKASELLADAGMTASSYGSLTLTNDLSGPSLEEQVWEGRQLVEEAATLGCKSLVFHSGGQGGHLRKNRFCVVKKVIDQLLPIAEEYGVKLGIEPLTVNEISGKSHSHTLEDCVELIDQYRSPFVGLVLDLFHVENQFSMLSPEWFGQNVCLIQLSDFSWDGQRKYRVPLGQGSLELQSLEKLAADSQYGGAFEYELFGEAFDLIGYQQTISGVADELSITPNARSIEFESIKA